MKMNWKKICAVVLTGVLGFGMTGGIDYADAAVNTKSAAIDQIPGTVRSESELNGSFLSVSGFAEGKVNDRSQYKEGDSKYAVVTNAVEFFQAINNARFGKVDVIEIREDLYLGWNEIPKEIKDNGYIEPYVGSQSLGNTPVANPVLIESGISTVTLNDLKGLTIFSKTGNTIKHAEIKLNAGCDDIVIRNLRFDEMWEWDDYRPNGFGSTGGKGNHKRNGWTLMKINGAKNVWLDHCSFGLGFDGNVDIENGSSGITMSWCEFGDANNEIGSMIYKTAMYLEELYQESKKPGSTTSSFVQYGVMRDNGMSMEQIMQFMSYHDKCHLSGAGDKDTWLKKDANGNLVADTTKTNANERIRLTLAYNHYTNIGQRLPMIRSGVGHLYNCYIDDMKFAEMAKFISENKDGKPSIRSQMLAAGAASVVVSTNCINARNEASIGADTCVFYGAENPIVGAEHQQDDLVNMSKGYEKYWTWNHSLIVNSSTTKVSGKDTAYVGSSWDNAGVNPFTTGFTWRDKSTINNWSWGQEGDKLSYEYQTFPLEDVKDNTTKYSGAYKLDMSAEDWLKTEYTEDFEVKAVDKGKEVPVQSLEMDKKNAVIFADEYLQLGARIAPSNAALQQKDLKWTSSNEKVAKVNNCGLVTPLSLGETIITVTAPDGKTAECKVTVSQLPTAVEIVDLPSTIYVGDTYQYKADVQPGKLVDESVIWTSGTRFRVVDENKGLIEATDAGNSDITATANLRGNRVESKAVSGTARLKIVEPSVYASGVELAQKQLKLVEGTSKTLTAKVLPANASNSKVRWEVADPSVATVDNDGVVTALSEGTTTVTAISVNKGFKQTCEVTVGGDLVKGDVNGDNKVDVADALAILSYVVGKQGLSDKQITASDVDKNAVVNANDALKILKYSVGKITQEEWDK